MTNLFKAPIWKKTDESIWLDNCRNHEELELIYGRIYTVGESYNYSYTNDQIKNLKISPSLSETSRYKYKKRAIRRFADELGTMLKTYVPINYSLALIPIPPSKTPEHDEYDDRMLQVAKIAAQQVSYVHFWPLLDCIKDRESFYTSGTTRYPSTVYNCIDINEAIVASYQSGEILCLLDDVLTSGANFSACRRKILERFPNADVRGIFLAKAQEAGWEDGEYDDEFEVF
ncbi:hypothetical protein D0962_20650 [Leptolyngbyaceae cyanobacterium CCMR0082]|uniref:Phosphoribosyltransferase domain-containing protein n=1 Tax=Adonisia turfae CCMR0082 TaxID=2304604 RepID=A0A6M0S9I9_9CYAN|nr:hypothetical protein [Adonisia turfae]NEZ65154.1 hypothetical protein [Adonisia turfae CCMR0082]